MEENTLTYDWILSPNKDITKEDVSPIFPNQLMNAKKSKHLWFLKITKLPVIPNKPKVVTTFGGGLTIPPQASYTFGMPIVTVVPSQILQYIDLCLCLAWAESEYYFFTDVELKFKFSNGGQWLNILNKKHLFHITFNTMMSVKNLISLKVINDLHHNKLLGPLQISCRLKIQAEKCTIHTYPKEILEFEGLLNNSEFSDFIVSTSSKEFKVHKCILAMRSEVFAAMFRNDMKEKDEGVVQITDFDDEVVAELLRYIYCGKVENMKKLSKDLLQAADKYSVDGLKAVCLEEMCKVISIDNAVELLSLAGHFKVDHLKSFIINFIIVNLKEIDETSFKSLDNFGLMPEILLKIRNHIL